MIAYQPRDWWRQLVQLRGSVVWDVLARVALMVIIAGVAAIVNERMAVAFPPTLHVIIGPALLLLLVFRTNASYDRYWEGRKFLGTMVNRSRDISRQIASWVPSETDRRALSRHVRLLYALIRHHLRNERNLGLLGGRLTAEEKALLEPVETRPTVCAEWISRRLGGIAAGGGISEQRLLAMDRNLSDIVDAMGGCERIAKTPLPFAYAQHVASALAVFCFTIPFVLVDSLGWATPLAALVVGWILFGLDAIGVEIEDPFGFDPNDLPIDAIGGTIDEDVTAMLGAGVKGP